MRDSSLHLCLLQVQRMTDTQTINFEMWAKVPQLYWLTIKVGNVPYGHIARNFQTDDQYILVVYQLTNGSISNRVVEHFDTVIEAKKAFFSLPIGELLSVTSSVC